MVSDCLEGDVSTPDSTINFVIVGDWLLMVLENYMEGRSPLEKINRQVLISTIFKEQQHFVLEIRPGSHRV